MTARPKRPKSMVITMVLVVVVLIAAGGTGWLLYRSKQASQTVNSFAECQKSPGSVMLLTYPGQCHAKSGQTFTDPSQSLTAPQ